MHAAHLLSAVLAQVPAAASADAVDLGWLGQALSGIPLLAVLGLLWRVSTWHSETDSRLKAVEAVQADSRGNPGCAARHLALEAAAREAPTKGSVADAFDQIRSLERSAAEDRRSMEVALARIEATLQALVERFDSMAGEGTARPLGRQRTNPGFDPRKGG